MAENYGDLPSASNAECAGLLTAVKKPDNIGST
jgi:hypothetical protein